MIELLCKVIPLDFASTLSPGILALSVILLTDKKFGKIHLFYLFLGILMLAIIVNIVGFSIGKIGPSGPEQNLTSASVDIILGIIFIAFGIKVLVSKERAFHSNTAKQGQHIFKWITIGFLISALNFDALFFSLAAAKEVGDSQIESVAKIVLMLLNVFFVTLPATFPLVLYVIFPVVAHRILEKVNKYVLKYSRFILFIIFIIFGLVLLKEGLSFFI